LQQLRIARSDESCQAQKSQHREESTASDVFESNTGSTAALNLDSTTDHSRLSELCSLKRKASSKVSEMLDTPRIENLPLKEVPLKYGKKM